MAGQQQGVAMFFLRAWMWFVPVAMLAAAVVFGVIAVLDGQWGLLGFMVFVGVIALAMLIFHWWILYRFGQTAGGGR